MDQGPETRDRSVKVPRGELRGRSAHSDEFLPIVPIVPYDPGHPCWGCVPRFQSAKDARLQLPQQRLRVDEVAGIENVRASACLGETTGSHRKAMSALRLTAAGRW